MIKVATIVLLLIMINPLVAFAASSEVTITPLGSHDGEFCRNDRALVFEDPDGTRILYDAGKTVRAADDPRLGKIDIVLLSHVHGDHLGDQHASQANSGSCEKPSFDVDDAPNSNTLNIVVSKKATLLLGGEMASFFKHRLKSIGADENLVSALRFGGNFKKGKIEIASVPAVHSNGLSPKFLDGELAKHLDQNGLTAYVGPPNGYIVKFSNGLVVYLSGDTGVTAEQDLVVRQLYHANLAVINIGDTYTTGPQEAAWVINEMIKPKAVIASHANEAATKNGKWVAGTRSMEFKQAVKKIPVYLPLSGVSMRFNGKGACVSACN